MKLRKPKQESGIDISSLIDVLFILLIFLMLAVRFSEPTSSISLDLPKSKTESIGNETYAFKIQIKTNGDLYKNDTKMDMDTFVKTLENNPDPNKTVSLEVDQHLEFGIFVTVTDILKQKNYQKIEIKTEKQ
ncbi:ExbD-related biopolymer transport protein [Leptospira ellinghausenii]|uniref:ExbD-related biopolymer transport protein n=1 Tax=Leptospira ellinghausenii TaxID=1917822 RepID=A0A2P2DHM0_9LEPT|nr:biopolymer transporter ExbD [Leptospira ellinghausenii]GBF44111.1 ExbD-related biopolymer transport protein [Leptospira ellinghausenii]